MKLSSMLRGLLVVAAFAAVTSLPARAADVQVDGNLKGNCGTATGTSNASTLANHCGVITTESATTAAGATFLETITNTAVAATDICFARVNTAGTGTPAVTKVTEGAGTLAILIQNVHASAAFNNTLSIGFACWRP